MIDEKLNNDIAAKIWQTVLNFFVRKDIAQSRMNTRSLYLYAQGYSITEIAEKEGVTYEAIRLRLNKAIDELTNEARIDGYFALQIRCESLQKEISELIQKVFILENMARNFVRGFTTTDEYQKKQLEKRIADIDDAELPKELKELLKELKYEYIWQIAVSSLKELTKGRLISRQKAKKIEDYLHSIGLSLEMRLPTQTI